MRNTILALGCSYTDPNYRAYHSFIPADFPEHLKGGWKMWPEVFRDKLSERDGVEYKLINAGKSASGMDYQANEFFQHWVDYKNDLKIVLWGGTSWHRLYHITNKQRYSITDLADPKKPHIKKENYLNKRIERMKADGMYEYAKSVALTLNSHEARKEIVRKYISMLVGIKDLCESNNVDFMFYQLLEPMTTSTFHTINEDFIKEYSEYNAKFPINQINQLDLFRECKRAWKELCNSKYIIGLNESSLISAWSTQYKKEKYTIADNDTYPNNDSHPNELGQVHIGEIFWNHYTS